MSDDKNNRGASDQRRVAGGEPYEVEQIARTMGVSTDRIHDAIAAVGNDRAKIKAWLTKH